MLNDLKYYLVLFFLSFFSIVNGQVVIHGPAHIYSGDKACFSVDCGATGMSWSTTIGSSLGKDGCGRPPLNTNSNQFQFPVTFSSILSGTISVSGACQGSGTFNVQVYPPMGGTAVTPSTQTVLIGTAATPLVATIPSGWDGNFAYSWQSTTDGGSTWNNIPGATNRTYTPPTTTWGTLLYRVTVTAAGASDVHNMTAVGSVTVVNPPIIPGVLTPASTTLTAGTGPGVLTVTKASGGGCNGNFVYQWQSSTDGISWSDITGVMGQYYNPGNLSSTIYYRVKVICGPESAYTAVSKMTIGTVATDLNYIRERGISKPGVIDAATAAGLTDLAEVKQSTQYFDGLGRPVQKVVKQASPSLHDMVTMQVYDPFNREIVKYLPYTSPSSDGNYKTNPTGEQSAFNTSQFPTDQFYYGQVAYEPSPLNRPLTTYQAGNSWVGSGKGIGTQYLVNTAADSVCIWRIADAPGSLPVTSAYFPPGTLYETITLDESNHQAIEYKDKSGHAILKKVQLWDSPAAGHSGWLCTYYIYDDFNNLRFVIQPMAVDWLKVNSWSFAGTTGADIARELCFRYEYDQRNRMIIQKAPGGEEVRMVYDIRDRLVMSQDSVLRSQKKWQVFCYDALNRQDTMALMSDPIHYNDHRWHLTQAAASAFYPLTAGYVTEVVTELYYDSYDWVTALGSVLSATVNTTYNNNTAYFFTTYNTAPNYAVPMSQYSNTKGMSTGYRTKIIDTTQFLYYVPFYDDHGRIIGTQSTNYTNGFDQEWTQYDFSGKPLRKLLFHKKNSARPEGHLITTKYAYDAGGRTTSIRKVMDGPEARIDTMMYNELGQLRAKYFANNLDSLVYDYNIRGWMTNINKKYLTGAATNYFGMELGYDNPASGVTTYSTPQFSGNIAGTVWKSAGDGMSRKYDLSYDNVGRITGAAFTQYNGTTFAPSATIDFNVPTIIYDANGNILSMIQNGFKLGASGPIDRLKYSYFTNTNRLQQVYDTANDAGSLLGDLHYNPSTKDPATDYAYDANGSLISDKNKGIKSIQYNFLHRPAKITFLKSDGSPKGNIVYKYDAQGNKWAKIVTDSTVSPVKVTTTMYIKGFQYQNDTIQFVSHEEGRTRYFWEHYMNGDSAFRMRFDYFEKDHLGNIRVILTDQRDTVKYMATMEAAYRDKENKLFYNIPATSVARTGASGYPVDLATTNPNDSVIRLGNNGQKIGPAIILKVMSGDKVTIGTNYYFNSGGTAGSQQLNAQDLINSLAGGIVSLTGGSHGSFSDLTGSSTPLTGALNSFITQNNTTASGKPNAYLNWVLLDNQFAYVSTPGQSGATQVVTAGTTGNGGLQQPLATTINLKTSGYLYIYISNASPTWDVYFDNLAVMHYAGPMVEENHYYPYGLTMAGISDKALKGGYPENKYRYNKGSELQNKEFGDGSGLEFYETPLRGLDPQLGRWWQLDPKPHDMFSLYTAMADNPILYSDPMGDTTWVYNQNGVALGVVPDKLKNQVHYVQTDGDPEKQFSTKGMSKKEIQQLGKSFREQSFAFIGGKTVADMHKITDQSVALKREVGFVGTIGKDKEIRLSALPVDNNNQERTAPLEKEINDNYPSAAQQSNIFLFGHTHVSNFLNGWTSPDPQKAFGFPTPNTSEGGDYGNFLYRNNDASQKGPSPALLLTPWGVTVYGSTPGEKYSNNTYLLYKSLKQ
ncbi:MAG: hypothetical protein J0H74_15025 [Chitinophagaceae bacterium]|nr:hypothetical protein [Chitinophagaceae bacterium]